MKKSIVFIHGAWMTPLCWEKFTSFFEGKGYQCLAPAWPHRDHPTESLRSSPPAELAGLGVKEIVDHYERIIRTMDPQPFLIGHSFGGLFVQQLLDRGLAKAGVAIHPAPPRGILPFQPSVIRANFHVLTTWKGWKKILRMSFADFQYAFVNTMPLAAQQEAYDRYVVPETGRIFFQAATALMDVNSPLAVNFANSVRAPLLLLAGSEDNIVPAVVNKKNFRKYEPSKARTDFMVFEGRSHWTIGQEGWEEVAEYTAQWLASVH